MTDKRRKEIQDLIDYTKRQGSWAKVDTGRWRFNRNRMIAKLGEALEELMTAPEEAQLWSNR